MSTARIEVPLPRQGIDLSQMRSEVEATLAEIPVDLEYWWDGDVLRFSALATEGQVYVRDGHICAQAKFGLPTSLFKSAIMRHAKEGLTRFVEGVK